MSDLAQNCLIMPAVRFKNTGVNMKEIQKILENGGEFLCSVFGRQNTMRGEDGLFGEYAGFCPGG